MQKRTRIILICICAVLLIVSAWQIIDICAEGCAASSVYDKAQSAVGESLTPSDADRPTPPITVDFNLLLESNGDTVGWIYSEGTPINYPVMQSEDNEWYVYHLADGTYNKAGSIFMDFRCAASCSDTNTIIYGHNMKNGTMFASLKKYYKQSYYDEHPVIWLYTPEQIYMLEVIAGYTTSTDSDAFDLFPDRETMQTYLQKAVDKSDFVSAVNIEAVERVATLATCSYEYDTARYVLVANIVPYEAVPSAEESGPSEE